jgi:hypothetical protein
MRAVSRSGKCRLAAQFGLIALFGLGAGSARAATVSFTLTGFDPNPYSVFGRSVVDPANNTRVTSDQMDGGRFLMTRAGGDYSGTLVGDGAFYGFCIEPREFVNLGGSYVYDVANLQNGTTNISGMGEAKADRLRELFGRYLPDFSAPLSRLVAGALQIATWEIVREDSGTLNVYGGDIWFYSGSGEDPAGSVALAQSYVTSLDGTGPKLSNLIALTKVGSQDIVTQFKPPIQNPEPAACGLIGAGLVLMAFLRRRQAGKSVSQ